MREINWEKEMPEVPEMVHEVVVDALKGIESREAAGENTAEFAPGRVKAEPAVYENRRKKPHKRRRILLAAAVMAVMMGMTAFAAELIWNSRAVEAFNNPSAELQQDMIDNGVAVLPDAFATDQGITVTAVQALQDENRIYLLFRVEAEEAVIDDNSGFEGWKLYADGSDRFFGSMGAWFMKSVDGQQSREGYYVIDALKDAEGGWNGSTLQVALSDFSYYTYENYDPVSGSGEQTGHRIAGSWVLEIPLTDTSALSRTIQVNRDIMCRGVAVTVNTVKLSPISLVISYEEADIQKIGTLEDDYLAELFEVKLEYRDGTMEDQGYAGTSGWITEDGQYMIRMELTNVVDMEQLAGIVLGNGTVSVKAE